MCNANTAIQEEINRKVAGLPKTKQRGILQSDYVTARSLLEESLEIHRKLGDRRGIAQSLHQVGLCTHEMGDHDGARSMQLEGLEIQRELGNRIGIADSLEALARLASEQRGRVAHSVGDECAPRLFGAAEALREAIGAPLSPSEQENHQRHVASARAARDEEAFAAAWAEGRKMSLEHAIEYALNHRAPE